MLHLKTIFEASMDIDNPVVHYIYKGSGVLDLENESWQLIDPPLTVS